MNTTEARKTWRFNVCKVGDILVLTSQSGQKSLAFDHARAQSGSNSESFSALLRDIRQASGSHVELDMEQMKVLADLRDRQNEAAPEPAPAPEPTRTVRVFRNERSGEEVRTDRTNREAVEHFLARHGDDDSHWLWYWLHKAGAEPAPAAKDALAFIGDSFVYAIGRGLKRPMLRLHYRNQRFKFYLSQRGTVCLKTGALSAGFGSRDPVGDEYYIGCLLRGRFLPVRDRGTNQERPLNEVEREFLNKLCEDPVGFIAQCGKDMSRCCYCNQPLEDARSREVGYGPTCASRWGLPWGDKAAMEHAPSFAKAHDRGAAGLCLAIRKNPTDAVPWLVLADWLEERDLPRVEQPQKGVTLPRED